MAFKAQNVKPMHHNTLLIGKKRSRESIAKPFGVCESNNCFICNHNNGTSEAPLPAPLPAAINPFGPATKRRKESTFPLPAATNNHNSYEFVWKHELSECPAVRSLICSELDDELNVLNVLNDHLHLIEFHRMDQVFEYILNECACDMNPCPSIVRLHHSGASRSHDFPRSATYDIYDSIHCYYMHALHTDTLSLQGGPNGILNDAPPPVGNDVSPLLDNTVYLQRQLRYIDSIGTTTPSHSEYSFGVAFHYGYPGECMDKHTVVITPKYSDLKEELTHHLSLVAYDTEYEKAQIRLQTNYLRRNFRPFSDDYIDRRDMSTKPAEWRFGIPHLLAIQIYCNYTSLQYSLSKTYREDIEQHTAFYHWGKYLKIAIKKFGTRIKNSEIKSFYHGISQIMTFQQYINSPTHPILIHGALSTSSSRHVALQFTNNSNGIVVEFAGYNEEWTKYLSVSWLSDYANEMECLFVQNNRFYETLRIKNIIEPQHAVQYAPILNALELLDELVTDRAQAVGAMLTGTDRAQIVRILRLQLSSDPPVSTYCRNMMQRYFEGKTKIIINFPSLLFGGWSFLQHLFMIQGIITGRINMPVIHRLFPNLTVITIRGMMTIRGTVNFQPSLDSLLAYLKTERDLQEIWLIKPELIVVIESDSERHYYRDIVEKYKAEFNAVSYNIRAYEDDEEQKCILIEKQIVFEDDILENKEQAKGLNEDLPKIQSNNNTEPVPESGNKQTTNSDSPKLSVPVNSSKGRGHRKQSVRKASWFSRRGFYECHECNKQYGTKSWYNRHRLNVHSSTT